MQAAEDAENSQADTCSRVRGMLSPAHLTLSRPLCPPTAYKTDGLPGLMSLWMTSTWDLHTKFALLPCQLI